jgi:aarF domain-containing kinase
MLLQSKELVDMVGLDPAVLEDAGFMDGFATVLDNLANPGSSTDHSASEKDRERAQKIRMLNEQVKFRLPPYFVLILRAFSVIEGIALKVDPQYSIITETFPYLSRRLLTDDNEEVRRALRQVLYGDRKRMDMERFKTLFESLQNFTTDGLTNGNSNGQKQLPEPSRNGLDRGEPILDKNTVLALQSILSVSGTSYIQELLVQELAATVESVSRGAAVAMLQSALQSSLTSGTLSLLERLGPLRPIVFPFPLPAEIIAQLGNVVTLTEEDEVAIKNVRVAWGLLRPQLESQVGQGQLQLSLVRSFAQSVQELPGETRRDLVAGASRTSQMVLQQVLRRTMSRFAQDVANVQQQRGAVEAVLGRGTQAEGRAELSGSVAMRGDHGVNTR